MSNLNTEIEKAFDYRGDVTLSLKDGRQIEGYLFNRESKGSTRCVEPFTEIMPQGSAEKVLVKFSEIANVAFTGEDTAAGKSYEEWIVKEAAKKKAVV